MSSGKFSYTLEVILKKKVTFLLAFFVIFTVSYAILAWIDFLPEPKVQEPDKSQEVVKIEEEVVVKEEVETLTKLSPEGEGEAILPKAITIESLGRTVKVLNPTSHLIADLDADLLHGVVRHPDSAALNQLGTVFILGHSSYLPAVKNPNFQAFNGLQNLQWGDMIVIHATEGDFTYRVDRVFKAKTADYVVPIAGETQKLVIATCNSFGSTDDRYIVEAELIKKTLY